MFTCYTCKQLSDKKNKLVLKQQGIEIDLHEDICNRCLQKILAVDIVAVLKAGVVMIVNT